MAISPQRLTVYLYSAHHAVIFAIAQLSCFAGEGRAPDSQPNSRVIRRSWKVSSKSGFSCKLTLTFSFKHLAPSLISFSSIIIRQCPFSTSSFDEITGCVSLEVYYLCDCFVINNRCDRCILSQVNPDSLTRCAASDAGVQCKFRCTERKPWDVTHTHGLLSATLTTSTQSTMQPGLSRPMHDDLHWLTVPQRVQYKLAVTVHRFQHRAFKISRRLLCACVWSSRPVATI